MRTPSVHSLACGFALVSFCAANPALSQSSLDEEFVVIKAKKVITVSGDEIENGEVVIVDGVIRLVGTKLEYPANATVIDAQDQVVMPGMVHLHTRADLPMFSRSGVQAHRSVTEEVFLDEIDFEPFLREGYTAVCLVPPGNGIPGASAVYRTAGGDDLEDRDEFRLLGDAAFLRVAFDKAALRGAFEKAESEIEKVEKARKEWEEQQKKAAEEKKQAESGPKPAEENKPGGNGGQNSGDEDEEEPKEEPKAEEKPAEFKPPDIDPAHARIVDLIQKKAAYPMLLEVGDAADVLHAHDVMEKYEQVRIIWYPQAGGFRGDDFHYIVADLGGRNASVMLTPSLGNLPNTADRYNLAAELVRSGCSVSFVPGGLSAMRGQIAEVVRAGLPRQSAIEAVTMNPMKFLSLDKRFGSIERDKEADLIFLDDDPLNPFAKVKRVMIHGDIVWEDDE